MIWKRHQTFGEWLADNPEPNLQEFVQRFNGFSRVPPEAWLAFNRRMQRWREAYRRRHEEGGEETR
jgi:hypothetical protein